MQGRKNFTQKMFYQVCLNDLVPQDNFYRRLDRCLDLRFLYSATARKISRICSRTVEPVLGTLINYTHMRRVNTRGMSGANKHVLMAALTYNLKKWMKWSRKRVKIAVQASPKNATIAQELQNAKNLLTQSVQEAIRANFFIIHISAMKK